MKRNCMTHYEAQLMYIKQYKFMTILEFMHLGCKCHQNNKKDLDSPKNLISSYRGGSKHYQRFYVKKFKSFFFRIFNLL